MTRPAHSESELTTREAAQAKRRLTVADILDRLQIDRSTFYRRVAPYLRGIRVGRALRYRESDVARFEAQRTQLPPSTAPQPPTRPITAGLQTALRRHGLIR